MILAEYVDFFLMRIVFLKSFSAIQKFRLHVHVYIGCVCKCCRFELLGKNVCFYTALEDDVTFG